MDNYVFPVSEYSEKELDIFKRLQKKTTGNQDKTLSNIPDYNYVGDFIETVNFKCYADLSIHENKEFHGTFVAPHSNENHWFVFKNLRLYSGDKPYPFEKVEQITMEVGGGVNDRIYGKYSDALTNFYQIEPETKTGFFFNNEPVQNSIPFHLFKLGLPMLKYNECKIMYKGICPKDLNIRADVYEYTGPFMKGCLSGINESERYKHINDLVFNQFKLFRDMLHPVTTLFGLSKEPIPEFKLKLKLCEPVIVTVRATSIIESVDGSQITNIYKLPNSITFTGYLIAEILDDGFIEMGSLNKNSFRCMSGMGGTAFGHY